MARITWKGEDLGHWSGKPTLKECRRIKAELGLSPTEFQEQFEDLDSEAWSMFVAIMLTRKRGELVNFEDVDGEYEDLARVPDKDDLAAVEEAKKADEGKAPSDSSESAKSNGNESDDSKPALPILTN